MPILINEASQNGQVDKTLDFFSSVVDFFSIYLNVSNFKVGQTGDWEPRSKVVGSLREVGEGRVGNRIPKLYFSLWVREGSNQYS